MSAKCVQIVINGSVQILCHELGVESRFEVGERY